MVQLAVLWPVLAYHNNHPSQLSEQIIQALTAGIPGFFDEKIHSFGRWLPKDTHQLDDSEEQKKPRVMDSWYLHHPLLNLSFILRSGHGDEELRKKFFQSVEFCIQVAQHFEYQWPIFYDLDTLDIVKAEAKPGKGGEKDVGGLYAFLMLRAFELSKKKKYLQEAKKAAKTLVQHDFDILYQANNTAYAAEALLELWSMTKEDTYLRLSEICIGHLLRNTAIWEMNYGNAKEYSTFFMLFPLQDAPYAALFEEHECVGSFNRYLALAHRTKAPIAPEIQALLPEYVKYTLQRMPSYFPPMLPEDILTDQAKTGYIDKKLWIPVEDLGDGWEAVGTVGQEVYGAGALFQAANYHLHELDSAETVCFIAYPVLAVNRSRKSVTFRISGSSAYTCPVAVMGERSASYTIITQEGEFDLGGHQEPILVKGGDEVTVKWS